jgi:hypothetical protein
MNEQRSGTWLTKSLGATVGAALGAYATYVAVTWYQYGRRSARAATDEDPLLDRFMPRYDVAERHSIRIGAPAGVTLAVAREMALSELPLARAIFKARELILRSTPDARPRPRGLLAEMQSLGWVLLEEVPGRELVVGAVTKPWEANVTFRSVPPEEFAAFDEPDYVKIAWTLRADPMGRNASLFRTDTRALATDAAARGRFRWYWSFLSPGISLIRWAMLAPLKAAAEARAERYAAPVESGRMAPEETL